MRSEVGGGWGDEAGRRKRLEFVITDRISNKNECRKGMVVRGRASG